MKETRSTYTIYNATRKKTQKNVHEDPQKKTKKQNKKQKSDADKTQTECRQRREREEQIKGL